LGGNAEKASLGITVAQSGGPIGPPTTCRGGAPIISIECGNRLQQVLGFVAVDTNAP